MLSTIIGLGILIIFLMIIPFVLGIPWTQTGIVKGRVISAGYSYLMGFFVMLALFELFMFPSAIFVIPFNYISIVYSVAIVFGVIGTLIYSNRKKIIKEMLEGEKIKWSINEILFCAIFVGLLLIQLYYALFYSRTYMADDGYVAFSSAALSDNYINTTDFYSGLYIPHDASWLSRVIQSYNYFPAYLSFISGIKPVVIAHTVIYVFVVILAYTVYLVLAYQIFESRENILLFLIFVSLLYIFGYHSHYSITFRLLGPNSEGKAILAVVLSPFMLCIMKKVIEEGYRGIIGIQILVLSITSCCLTLGGVYTMVAVLLSMVIIAALKNKSIKVILYLLWGGFVPAFFASLYVYYRFRWG